MDDSVTDRVGDRGIAYNVEPLSHRYLGSDNGRGLTEAVLNDLKERQSVLRIERHKAEVVEYQ